MVDLFIVYFFGVACGVGLMGLFCFGGDNDNFRGGIA